jgi:hypothetical protein
MATRIKKITIGTPKTTPTASFLSFDSDNTIGIVDSSYVQLRQTQFFDSVDGNWHVNRTILPSTDLAYSLGDSTHRFKDLYVGDASVHIGNIRITESDGVFVAFINDSVATLDLSALSTNDLPEGDNLFYTTARHDSDTLIQVDSSYVQGRQDYAYSSLTNTPNILDSVNVQSLITEYNYSVYDSVNAASQIEAYGYTTYDSGNTTGMLSSYATQSYVTTQINNLIDGAPATLDTLNEIAAALNDDDSAYATLVNLIGTKTDYDSANAAAQIEAIIDEDYIQARQNLVDSASIINLVDSAYVQLRQDYAYGSLTGSPKVFDSAQVLAITTADLSTDSGVTTQIIYNVVDSGYVQTHAIGLDYNQLTNLPSILDSSEVINFIDSAYVQARQVDIYRDSGFVTSIVDSAYVTARASTYDSANTIGLVDSAYVQARQADIYRDSGFVTNIVDSAYVTARASTYDSANASGQIEAYGYTTYDSSNTLGFGYTTYDSSNTTGMLNGYATESFVNTSVDSAIDALVDGAPGALDTLNELAAALNDDSQAYNTLLSNIAALPDSAQVATIIESYGYTTYDSTNTIGLIDSAYVQARQADIYRDSGFVTDIADSAYIQARQITYTVYTDSDTRLLVDSAYVQARQADIYRDSGFVTNIVDSAYVRAHQDYDYESLNSRPNILDSVNVQSLITEYNYSVYDSANASTQIESYGYTTYDSSNTVGFGYTTYDSANTIGFGYTTYDSSNTVGLVDAAYVQARQTAQDFAYGSLTGTPNILDSVNVQSLITEYGYTTYDSSNTIGFGYTTYDSNNASGQIEEYGYTTYDSSNTVGLIDSAYISARQITYDFLDSSEAINLIDSAHIQARQITYNVLDSASVANILKNGSIDLINFADSSAWLDYNSTDATLNLNYGGVSLQIGQEQHIYGKASENIANGDVVMFAGAQGDHILFAKADPTVPGFIDQWIIGVATQAIANNNFGYVTTFGKVRELNTGSYNAGDLLYLDNSTPGGLTKVKPVSPDHIILVAAVTRVNNADGHILVRPTFGNHIHELHDVLIDSIGLTHKQILAWDSNNQVWTNFNQSFDSSAVLSMLETDSVTMANLVITGNLQVDGTQNIVNTQSLAVEDNMIYLNSAESAGSPTQSIDIGFAGNYNEGGSYAHAGLFRDATDQIWKFYDQYTPEPDAAVQINTGHASFNLAAIQAGSLSGKYLGFDSDFNKKTVLDSAEVQNVIDATYVQANQITYDNVSEFTNDANYLDSTTVQGVINSTYVEANQITYDNVSEFTNDANYLDSTTVQGVINSTYVEGIIDATYVQANQITYDNVSEFTNDANYLDSTTVQGVIDSAYVIARASGYDSANATGQIESYGYTTYDSSNTVGFGYTTYDSANTIGLVDSAYVAARSAAFDSASVARLYYNGTDVKAEATNTGITVTGDVNSTSDRTMKDNIEDLVGALETINQIQPVSFNWKTTGKKAYGVIAQEIEQVLPEIVSEDANGIKSVGYTQLIPFLIQAVQELQKEVDEIKNGFKD